jgi:hypothetical protein
MKKTLRAVGAAGLAAATIVSGLSSGPAFGAQDSTAASEVYGKFVTKSTSYTYLVASNPQDGKQLAHSSFPSQQAAETAATADWVFPAIGSQGTIHPVGSDLCLSRTEYIVVMSECSGALTQKWYWSKQVNEQYTGAGYILHSAAENRTLSDGSSGFRTNGYVDGKPVAATDIFPLIEQYKNLISASVASSDLNAGTATINGTVSAEATNVRVEWADAAGQQKQKTVSVKDGKYSAYLEDLKIGTTTVELTARVGTEPIATTTVDVKLEVAPVTATATFADDVHTVVQLSGTAQPKAKVTVRHGEDDLVTVKANAEGKWSTPINAPNMPGNYELTVGQEIRGQDNGRVSVDIDYGAGVVVTSPDDNFVLEPNEPLEIEGTAPAGTEVNVYDKATNDVLASTTAAKNNTWFASVDGLEDREYTLVAAGITKGNNRTHSDLKINPGKEGAKQDLSAKVESIDHAAGTATLVGKATPAATIVVGDQSVEVDENGDWELVVSDLVEGVNDLTVEQKIGENVIDSQDLEVTINTTAVIGQDGTAATLERGTTTKVQAQFKTQGDVSRPDAKVVFTAPEGTTFAEGQDTIQGSYQKPGEGWTNRSVTLTDGELSMNGKTYTYTFKPTTSTWTLPDASLLRWSIDVETPADAAEGSSSMSTNLVGTAVEGSFNATSTTTTTIETAEPAPADLVVTTPANGSTVDTKRPVFSGTGDEGATIQIKGSTGRIVATTVVTNGTWSVPAGFDLVDGSYALTATQTPLSGETSTASIDFTVAAMVPVTLTAPAIGATIETPKPVFAGRGTPGATVQVKGTYGTLLATATVKQNGSWEATSDIALAAGSYAGKAWQTVNGKTTTADFAFTIKQSITPVTLTTPAIGAEIEDTKPMFAGKGQPGATVQVKGTYGTLLATAVVNDEGDWEATSDVTLARGSYAGKAWQTVNGKTTTADFGFSIVARKVPVALTAPAQGAQINTPNPVFTGTGTPDADITITGAFGSRLASGKVRNDGGFDLTSTVALGAGSYSGTVRQDAGGKITTAPFQFRIVFTPVTLESPAIGAVLTDGTPVFSGEGTPKAPLTIKGSGGSTLATGTVKDDGSWSLTSSKTLAAGHYTGTVLQTLPGSETTAPFSFSVN